MTRELDRRLDRVEEGLGSLHDEKAFEPFRAMAARVLEDPKSLAPTRAFCVWLDEKAGGRRLPVSEMYARLQGWLREDPSGYGLMHAVVPFLDRAADA